jgi:hypothetical protein
VLDEPRAEYPTRILTENIIGLIEVGSFGLDDVADLKGDIPLFVGNMRGQFHLTEILFIQILKNAEKDLQIPSLSDQLQHQLQGIVGGFLEPTKSSTISADSQQANHALLSYTQQQHLRLFLRDYWGLRTEEELLNLLEMD